MRCPTQVQLLTCVAIVLALVGALARPASACSCHSPGPPCAELFTSTVFVGKAQKAVERATGTAVTTFDVIEVLHATTVLGKTVDVQHSSIGSMCGTTFEIGKTYVVYAGGEGKGPLGTGACSRTHVLAANDEDVAFAHAAARSTRTEAVIDGTVVLTDGEDARARAGVELRAAGTQRSVKSGAGGKFRLAVPPGEHTLEVVTPGLRAWMGEPIRISVPSAAACARPVVQVAWDGRIEGKLVDSAGKPVAGIEVFALARREADRHWRVSATTAADGSYVIHQVPAGAFYVAVSAPDFGGMDPQSPYPTTYYPGTPAKSAAKLVQLARAGRTTSVDFALPIARVVRTIRGTVRRADGSLAANLPVSLDVPAQHRGTGAATDAKGGFVFQDLDGTQLVLRACTPQGGRLKDGRPACAEQAHTLAGDLTVELVLP